MRFFIPFLIPSSCLVTYLESLFVIATHTKEPDASTFLTVTFDSTLGQFIGADICHSFRYLLTNSTLRSCDAHKTNQYFQTPVNFYMLLTFNHSVPSERIRKFTSPISYLNSANVDKVIGLHERLRFSTPS